MSLYALANQFRLAVNRQDEIARARLRAAYVPIFDDLTRQLARLTAQIETAQREGQVVSKAWLQREFRFRQLIQQTAQQIQNYSGNLPTFLTLEQQRAVNLALSHTPQIIAAGKGEAVLTASFTRLPTQAIQHLAGFMGDGTPLNRLFLRYGQEKAGELEKLLLKGLAQGKGVRETARAAATLLESPRWEAERISRTETLRAYRAAGDATAQANGQRFKQRLASKSKRTCAACLALDGHIYPIDAEPDFHVNCRCTYIYLPDQAAASQRQTAAEWFAQQSAEDQAKVLGVSGAKAYRDGLPLQNWIGVSKSKQWGEMRYQRSLADAQKGPQRGALPAPVNAKPHTAPKPAPVMPAPKPSLLSELQAPAQNVSVAVHGKKGREGLVKFLGRDFTDTEIAQAFGALDGAKVDIFEALDTYAIEITHPQIKSQERHLMRDGQGRLVIHNDLFLAAKDAPRGIGLRSFTRQVFGARKLGIDRIETFAAGSARSAVITEGQSWNGYYTWARFGYNGALTAQDLRDLPVEFQDVRDLHELFGRPGGAEAWKEFGSGHEMEFDLGPQSRSIDRLIEYVKGKERERK